MSKAVIYCRGCEEGQNFTLARQRERCLEFCTRRGFRVDKIFVDRNKSANDLTRSGLRQLLRYCHAKKGHIGYVVIWDSSRLARSVLTYRRLEHDLMKSGVELITATNPLPASFPPKVLERILAAVAELERRARSERAAESARSRKRRKL